MVLQYVALNCFIVVAISRQESDIKLAKLRKKVGSLKKKTQRQESKIKILSDLINDLREQRLIERQPADMLSNSFDSTILDLVKNEFQNHSKDPKGHRYSQSVKQFALTLFYYSPQAYEYCRSILSLPHPSSLRNWLSNVDGKPGFLIDVIHRYCCYVK